MQFVPTFWEYYREVMKHLKSNTFSREAYDNKIEEYQKLKEDNKLKIKQEAQKEKTDNDLSISKTYSELKSEILGDQIVILLIKSLVNKNGLKANQEYVFKEFSSRLNGEIIIYDQDKLTILLENEYLITNYAKR